MGSEGIAPRILNSALEAAECLASRRGRNDGTKWTQEWLLPPDKGWMLREQKHLCPDENQTPTFQPVVSCVCVCVGTIKLPKLFQCRFEARNRRVAKRHPTAVTWCDTIHDSGITVGLFTLNAAKVFGFITRIKAAVYCGQSGQLTGAPYFTQYTGRASKPCD
jgi:hypothetical protein